jgi:hypothetical protein
MSGVTNEDGIRTEYVRGKIGVAFIVDKMRENILRWFRNEMKREITNTVRVVMKITSLKVKEKEKT